MISVTLSCKKDDDGLDLIPPRDRGVEADSAQAEIEKFLTENYYNYEEFQTPPEGFDFKIRIDTIPKGNTTLTPLIEQVSFKEVKDRFDESVTYKFYYLKVNEGGGKTPHFSDEVVLSYNGTLLNAEQFDNANIPTRLDLTDVIHAFSEGMVEFKGAESTITNPDGSLSFSNYGIGAIFVPSGMGYFQNPRGVIGQYDQLIFTFQLYNSRVLDHDGDGIPSYMEDLNKNNYVLDDNTDNDRMFNYADNDDDGDGRLTRNEIEIDSQGNITFPDKNNDGEPDYLDKDN